MATQLIEFQDGSLVEIEVHTEQVREISGRFTHKVGKKIDSIRPLLLRTCRPIVSVFKEINEEIEIEHAEIELGLSFESEGNIYITKTKTGANLTVKLLLKLKK